MGFAAAAWLAAHRFQQVDHAVRQRDQIAALSLTPLDGSMTLPDVRIVSEPRA